MSNILLAIVAIALVTVLAGSGLFFGGKIYSGGKLDAEVARYLNESEQVASAMTLYESHGNEVTTKFQLQTLVDDNYLKQLPEGWTLHMNSIASPIAGSEDMKASICFESNKEKGFVYPADAPNTIPYINDEEFAIPICIKDLDSSVPCCFS